MPPRADASRPAHAADPGRPREVTPMFMRAAAPTETPLPWDDRPEHAHRDCIGGFQLDASAVSRFDKLLHEIHPEARHVDADRIASLGRWLQELPAADARAVLDKRLDRIEQLRATACASSWPTWTRMAT